MPARLGAVWCGLVVALGIVLRLSGLTVHSLWFDETMTVWLAQQPNLFALLLADRNPPLAFWLLSHWTSTFGDSDFAVRSLPAVVSSTTLLAACLMLRPLLPAPVTWWTLLLLAVSPFSIWYGQEVRTYWLVEAGCVVATIGALRLLSGHGRETVGCLLISLGVAVAVGANYTGVYLLLPLGVASLWLWFARGWRASAGVVAGTAVGLGLWSWWLWVVLPQQLVNDWGMPASPSWRMLLESPARLLLIEPDAMPAFAAFVPYLVLILLLAALLLAARAALRGNALALLTMLMWGAATIGSFAIAKVGSPVFGGRYLIAAELPLLLTVAIGLHGFGHWWRAVPSVLVLSLLALDLAHRRDNLKEDYQHACELVLRNWQPGDRIASLTGSFDGFGEAPLWHYLGDRGELTASFLTERELLATVPAAGRVHLVFREAPYSWPRYRQLVDNWRVVTEEPMRFRVQYLLLQPKP